jgi:lipoprotein-anchoring transpeptidase ErfK/SrfK
VPTQLLPNGELGWVKLGSNDFAVDSVNQSIVIDLSSMSAKLLRGGEVERRWTIGIGAPDTPTPTGTFSITDELEGGLNPVYGCCALALSATQPNLPAGWSGGNRMAIHGTTVPLGQANSTGCIHSSDEDLYALLDSAPIGTPVKITN